MTRSSAPATLTSSADTPGSGPGHPGPGVPEARSAVRASRRKTLVRTAAMAGVAAVLGVAIQLQRATIGAALGEMRGLSALAIGSLVALAIYERWSRADIVRRLLGDVSMGRAVTIHDVGNAVSKGVPMGGALGTAVRWTIARDSRVDTPRFATMLVGYGIATTFVSWLLPLVFLSLDLTRRPAEPIDIALIVGISFVLVASAVFWYQILSSDRIERWGTSRLDGVWQRLAGRFPRAAGHDPAGGLSEVRTELRGLLARPVPLLVRTVLAQLTGAAILLVALRGVGVGDELGMFEFFRVFFLTYLMGTFAPTPGGVGVVEAGMTGALVAAGVDAPAALAGVLVYRFLTYVVPIVFGAALYLVWSLRRTRRGGAVTDGERASADGTTHRPVGHPAMFPAPVGVGIALAPAAVLPVPTGSATRARNP